MTLKQKLVVAGTLLTIVPLTTVGVAVWVAGRRANAATTESTLELAHTDLDHVTQVAYLMTSAYHDALVERLAGDLRRANPSASIDKRSLQFERVRVGAEWHLALSAPGAGGAPLRVTVRESDALEDLLSHLQRVTIGKTGYVYVLRGKGDARGSYVLSLKRQRDGENLWNARDASGHAFIQDIVNKAVQLSPNEASELRYPWKNADDPAPRVKIARFKYFGPFDWVIAGSVPDDEYLSETERVASLNAQSFFTVLTITAFASVAAVVTWFLLSRSLTQRITRSVGSIRDAARQVAGASRQVASASQSLSQGATEQAASLEETSASMEEMAAMTRQNADHSQQAAGLMREVDTRVQESNAALKEMVTSMGAIEQSSQQVAQIIKTIDEIAFQTNILALNAAVEAARAGTAGMGFAVVADEVRALAQRSAQAAKNTSGLIAESLTRAQGGTTRVGEVAKAIAGITESVVKVKGLVEEVSTASAQQAQGIDQVSQAVAQMEKVTQTNAATAEESAAASEQLNAQAATSLEVIAELEQLVGAGAAKPPEPSTSPAIGRFPRRVVRLQVG